MGTVKDTSGGARSDEALVGLKDGIDASWGGAVRVLGATERRGATLRELDPAILEVCSLSFLLAGLGDGVSLSCEMLDIFSSPLGFA